MLHRNRPRSLCAPPGRRHGGESGFSIIEMLIVVGVIGIMSLMLNTFFAAWLPRMDLEQATRQTSFLIAKARLEAIKRGVPTVVAIDTASRTLTAFADVNGGEGPPRTLVFDPDPLLPETKTDYQIGFYVFERTVLHAPGSDAVVEGFTEVPDPPGAPERVLMFNPNGTPEDPGAFRMGDGAGENFFEVAVLGLTGKIEIRKYLAAEDAPAGSAGYFAAGRNSDDENLWTWY